MAEQDEEQSEQPGQPEQSPADDVAGDSAGMADNAPVAAARATDAPTWPLAAPAEAFAVTSPPARATRRGRIFLLAVSVVLLVTSLAATLYIGNGGAQGLFFAFTASASPTARATHLPATATATLTPTTGLPTSTATPRATPPIVGDGVATPVGTYPPYVGPVSGGQGCPSGQAPKPVSWAIHHASDYGAPRANVVALTFDDGPTPAYTPAILSYLEKTHTPATFFVLGQYAQAYPWLIRREAADGFTIGVHTWNHPDMQSLSPSQRAWQFNATVQQLHSDLGANTCIWLWRPPYGSYNGSVIAQAGSFGLTTVVWDDDPADWSQPGTMTIANRVLANVRPGSIILMHDGPAGRAQTLAALPYILDGLHKRGLTPVSLPQLLFGYQPPTPPPTPTHAPSPTPQPSPTDTPAPAPTNTPIPTATDTPTPTA